MHNRSIYDNPFIPKLSFIPIIMEAIRNDDKDIQDFKTGLGSDLCKSLLSKWEKLSSSQKKKFPSGKPLVAKTFTNKLIEQSIRYNTLHEQIYKNINQIVHTEFQKALRLGFCNYVPSNSIPTYIVPLIYRRFNMFKCCKSVCICNCNNSKPKPDTIPKYEVKINSFTCIDESERFSDEVYFISSVADDINNPRVEMTGTYGDVDAGESFFVNKTISGPNNLDNSLSVWIDLYEQDDSSTTETIRSGLSLIGSALTFIPNPWTIAGGLVAQVASFLWSLDDNDYLGNLHHYYNGINNINAAVGNHTDTISSNNFNYEIEWSIKKT